jgi:hypothetical protein
MLLILCSAIFFPHSCLRIQALLNAVDHLRSLDSQRSAPDKLESILEVILCDVVACGCYPCLDCTGLP